QIKRSRKRMTEIDTTAIHRSSELTGEGGIFHGLCPGLLVFQTAPFRRFSCAQDGEKILANGAVLQRGVIRAEKPRRVVDQVLAGQLSETENPASLLEKA